MVPGYAGISLINGFIWISPDLHHFVLPALKIVITHPWILSVVSKMKVGKTPAKKDGTPFRGTIPGKPDKCLRYSITFFETHDSVSCQDIVFRFFLCSRNDPLPALPGVSLLSLA